MTKTEKKPKNTSRYNKLIDTVIVLMIACCVIFMDVFTTSKFSDLEEAAHDAVFIADDIPVSENDDFAEELEEYLPDTYKMIELYDENMTLMFQIKFDHETEKHDSFDIRSYEDILSKIQNTKEGQAKINLKGSEQDFFYKWLNNNRGETRLLVVYSNVTETKHLWVFSFVCYLIMVLIFILLIRLHIRKYQDRIVQYKRVSDDVASSIKN